MKCHLMRVDKGSKGIMNLDPILNFGESWCIKGTFGILNVDYNRNDNLYYLE